MGKKKISEEVLLYVMANFKISRMEAQARIQFLYNSALMENADENDPEWRRKANNFLSHSAADIAGTLAFDKCLKQCMASEKFVKDYDRLNKTNFAKCLRRTTQGRPPQNAQEQMDNFSKFVRNTVFKTMMQKSLQKN